MMSVRNTVAVPDTIWWSVMGLREHRSESLHVWLFGALWMRRRIAIFDAAGVMNSHQHSSHVSPADQRSAANATMGGSAMKSSQNGLPCLGRVQRNVDPPECPEPGALERLHVSLRAQVEVVEFNLVARRHRTRCSGWHRLRRAGASMCAQVRTS